MSLVLWALGLSIGLTLAGFGILVIIFGILDRRYRP